MAVKHIISKGLIKCCSRCMNIKPIDSFSDSRATCDDCRVSLKGSIANKNAASRWKQKNPEKVKASSRRHYKKHANDYRLNYIEHAAEIHQSDQYLRRLICQGTILELADIPEELVAMKRAQMQLKRTILEM